MASFGASGLTNDWLSGSTLQDAVTAGGSGVAPRAQTFDWNNWSPTTPVHGIDDAIGNTTYKLGNVMDAYRSLHPSAALSATSGTTGPTGATATMGGDWSGVEQWQSAINSAASLTGLDPDQIKAVMKLESNGDPNASGAAGVWGPMQVNSNAWGDGPWMSDPNANILKGAQILKQNMDEHGGSFYEALRAYHGYGSDGYTTDTQYADTVMANYNSLTSGTASTTGAGFVTTGSSAGLTNLFGGTANVQGWGGFNVPSSNGLYGYSTQYGLNGSTHTGLDVVVPYGTPYRAAFSGKVVCAGTGVGLGADGTKGCAAFQDMTGGGAGRVEVQSDDGNTVIIYGHSSRSDWGEGTHVAAGQDLGVSGGENSDHVHVEVRVRDASMLSGWRIVDPTPYIGGAAGMTASGSAAPLSGIDQWRARTVGGVSTGAPTGTGLLDRWRAKYVGS